MATQIVNKKRFTLLIGVVVGLIAVMVFIGVKLHRKGEGKKESQGTAAVYEALVQPFEQSNASSEKDPSALQKGDVIVIFPEGHPWSESEKTSYLILKLKLGKEDADKLLEPVTKDVEKSGDEKDKGPQKETVRARKYRLKIENMNFDIQNFWENPVQPYLDQVFDSGMIEEKQLSVQ